MTYDVTIKVEHLLQHRDLLPRLRDTGCLFVTSAVESLDDRVLALLDKGHTRRDFVEAVALCRAAGLTLVPTFVAFHPWLTLEGYCDLLDTIAGARSRRPRGADSAGDPPADPAGVAAARDSRRCDAWSASFDAATLTYRWAHPDPRVDALHEEVSALVGVEPDVGSTRGVRRRSARWRTQRAGSRARLRRRARATAAGPPCRT